MRQKRLLMRHALGPQRIDDRPRSRGPIAQAAGHPEIPPRQVPTGQEIPQISGGKRETALSFTHRAPWKP